MSRLFEAGLLTANIRAITAKKNNESKEVLTKIKPDNVDWKTWYKQLDEQNNQLPSNLRLKEYDLEIRFFKEFYKSEFDEAITEQLINIGALLMKAFKILGYTKDNPFYTYIAGYGGVLVKEELLNRDTFAAIYNAVAKKQIATSELKKANNYNIIYCKDLYTKSPAEITKYIELQSDVLKADANQYTDIDFIKNKKIFKFLPEVKEANVVKRAKKIKSLKNPQFIQKLTKTDIRHAKLNDLILATEIKKQLDGNSAASETAVATVEHTDILKAIKNDPSQQFALLQFLSINAKSELATKALMNDKFKNIPAEKIASGTAKLMASKILPSGKISADSIAALVNAIIGNN